MYILPFRDSDGSPAAVADADVAGDVARLVGGQIDDGGVQLAVAAGAAHRGAVLDEVVHSGHGLGAVGLAGEEARADAVDGDALLGPLGGHLTGEVDDGSLAGGVVADGDLGQAAVAEDGGDVDYPAVAGLEHLAAEVAGAAHDAEDVGVDGVDPVLLGEIVQRLALAAAGVVDENVDPPIAVMHVLRKGLNGSVVAQIERKADCGIALAAERLRKFLAFIAAAGGDDDSRAHFTKSLRDRRAVQAASAGHDGNLPVETEQFLCSFHNEFLHN